MLNLALDLGSVWDFLKYGRINIRALYVKLIYMKGDGHQQGELFYDEEITKKSRQTIEEAPDNIEEVPEENED